MVVDSKPPRQVAIIGSGAAGLITGHVLRRDGFDVQILTCDKTPGGVWSSERVYDGLTINNVHGEFRFSPMSMPSPANSSKTGGRLTGNDMRSYMQTFSDRFLGESIRYETEVLNITHSSALSWTILVRNSDSTQEKLEYSHIVLCTGGCHFPMIPSYMSSDAAAAVGFTGLIIHSKNFGSSLDDLLSRVPPGQDQRVVIVGGGKSAQDAASYLANRGRNVAVVFQTADGFLAASSPLPAFIRKSSAHCARMRFLHTTWLGSKLVRGFWRLLQLDGYKAFELPADSPLRRTHSLLWSVRVSDEGVKRDDSFFSLVNAGVIELITPASVTGFTPDGKGVTIGHTDGRTTTLNADAIILATGYSSSWKGIFDEKTAKDLGLNRHPPGSATLLDEWPYKSLANPPPAHPDHDQWNSSIYRGIVPGKNITYRDFAINGAVFTSNNGYTFEVAAHWISAYFQNELVNIPASPGAAVAEAERYGWWLRRRHPDQLLWLNESYSSGIQFFSWPQYVDELLEDMGCRSMRSGGGWFTWPFEVMDLDEIKDLKEERDNLRVRTNKQL